MANQSDFFDDEGDPLDGLDVPAGAEALESGEADVLDGGQAQAQDEEQSLAPEETDGEQEQQAEDKPKKNDVEDLDRRLELAQLYRQLLDHDFFHVQGWAERRVQGEVRAFVRDRLGVLMGVRAPRQAPAPAQLPWTPEQVQALTSLANKVLGGGAPAKVAPPPQQPPAQVRAVAPAKPKIAQVPAAPAQKPRAQAPPPQPKPPSNPVQARPPAQSKASIDLERVPPKYHDDPSLTVKNGKYYVHAKDRAGEPMYYVDDRTKKRRPTMKDVTLPARPAPGLSAPVPTNKEGYELMFNSIASRDAAASLSAVSQKLGARVGSFEAILQGVQSNLTTKDEEERQ